MHIVSKGFVTFLSEKCIASFNPSLKLNILGNNFSRRHFEIFISCFSQQIVFGISYKLFLGDNLHEVSEPIFWIKNEKKYNSFVVCWICP